MQPHGEARIPLALADGYVKECDAPVPQAICTNDKYDYRNSTMDDIDDEDWQLQVEKAEVITYHLIENGYHLNL